jgi:hypothetical protein
MTKAASRQSRKSRATPSKLKQRKPAKSARRVSNSRQAKLSGADISNSSGGDQRPNTKQARVIALLRAPVGSTIGAIMQATGWQQHSVRGFLAGVVGKKLGLVLVSEASESGRVYRIVDRLAQANDAV